MYFPTSSIHSANKQQTCCQNAALNLLFLIHSVMNISSCQTIMHTQQYFHGYVTVYGKEMYVMNSPWLLLLILWSPVWFCPPSLPVFIPYSSSFDRYWLIVSQAKLTDRGTRNPCRGWWCKQRPRTPEVIWSELWFLHSHLGRPGLPSSVSWLTHAYGLTSLPVLVFFSRWGF